MTDSANLKGIRMEKILQELYLAQQCSFFHEDIMGCVMDKLGISKLEAIDLTKLLIKEELIITKPFLPSTFLRPESIRMFPIVLSTKALSLIKKMGTAHQ